MYLDYFYNGTVFNFFTWGNKWCKIPIGLITKFKVFFDVLNLRIYSNLGMYVDFKLSQIGVQNRTQFNFNDVNIILVDL